MLVAAPTGSGKTLVAEYAIEHARAAAGTAFYTTPLKALSNQKYRDLVREHGAARVGLLTGDNAINGDAPIVVMTTEVLRNMLYAGSATLSGLAYVVMDEVHYLADRFRGAVWEEVIIHLPESVQIAALSATVSNAEEFGSWIQTVRGDTTVVVDEHRPVPLWQHVMVGKRLFDLFDYRAGGAKNGRQLLVDPQLLRHIAHRREADRLADWRPRGRGGGDHRGRRPSTHRGPSRPDVIELLEAEQLLPAITFIFSRAGCDAAVKQCLRSSLRLTTAMAACQRCRRSSSGMVRARCIASAHWSISNGLTISALGNCAAAPAKRDRISTPVSSGFCAATYSLATRFMPSRNGVTSPTRATRQKPAKAGRG